MIYNNHIVNLMRNKMAKWKSFGASIVELFFIIILVFLMLVGGTAVYAYVYAYCFM